MRFWISFSLLLLTRVIAFGQNNHPDTTGKTFNSGKGMELSILTGYMQGKYSFVDLGVEFNQAGATGVHSFSTSYSISSEVKIGSGKTIIGPKIGVWIAGGPAIGLNAIYYTDFEKSSVVIRPEIGFGVTKFKLVYGYNWLLSNTLTGLNKSLVSLTFCFNVGRKTS